MAEQIDLAPTPIARLIKQTLPPISPNPHSPDNYRVSKELKAALQRAGGLFALYLAHTAGQVSKESGRQQVTPEDVLGALEEIDMDVLVQPTNEFVKAYRRMHSGGKAGSGDDLRPTRPSASGGSKKAGGNSSGTSGGKRKAPSGGSSKSKKSSGSAASSGGKKLRPVDLTAEIDAAEQDEDGQQHSGEAEEEVEEHDQDEDNQYS